MVARATAEGSAPARRPASADDEHPHPGTHWGGGVRRSTAVSGVVVGLLKRLVDLIEAEPRATDRPDTFAAFAALSRDWGARFGSAAGSESASSGAVPSPFN